MTYLIPTHAVCSAYLLSLIFVTLIGSANRQKERSSPLCSFHHSSVTSHLGSDVILSILLPDKHSPSWARDQAKHRYGIDTITDLFFMFLDWIRDDEIVGKCWKFPVLNVLFICAGVVVIVVQSD